MKREAPDSPANCPDLGISTPKKQKTARIHDHTDGTPSSAGIPDMGSPSRNGLTSQRPTASANHFNPSKLRTPTRKSQTKSLFSTPRRDSREGDQVCSTPSRTKNADQSAKRKSARVLFEQSEDEFWDGADRLAEEILEEESDEEANHEEANHEEEGEGIVTPGARGTAPTDATDTPRRRAGRPKGTRTRRSPTPEGELPPHERYFFQNRAGPPQTSNNTLSQVSLLTHEEYFENRTRYHDPHREEKDFLLNLHRRSFPQWNFEFSEQFNVCLYGYGSKRRLVLEFADWLHNRYGPSPPTIVVVNGYKPNLSIRSIFATIVGAILGSDTPSKLGGQPTEVLEFLQSIVRSRRSQSQVMVLIHSIDAPPLRRMAHQALLARLAATPSIHLLATADTPNFSLMWDLTLRDQFNFAFHDCTTFAAYEAEWTVVDEVNQLLGRRGHRVNGRDGVGFVLKSLPENARSLYRILLIELLSAAGSDDEDAGEKSVRREGGGPGRESVVEFRNLYQKASEEFIASSEMMFRTLLKEFHDHQMITSRMDASGAEILSVPLSREEMEGVLEDLVLS
jgi:origin recognition complex subunit 2